ncbi:dual specificity protein phosphatase 12-like [Paramacrobiotus metropolitanus]|uniref:dual specificity protein phosphatase 12-like n=1 Tax=Paramacrobiotus metropolitanus TaxID=2943436 RepID=UPI002445E09F|nr:dual specificity protein phosphatase 12-like [Paramacrobiotus metropolitanus]XP_055327905.1 dual specificity protein phosphatase 12-like [Paramacrobiotus metropolitanus]XP_055327906.1 dual specificity protein phosphatase 12-like [Paramacrobiotus metropolitanus]XP_055327907.1 dual specificity protein phosphatase 12-like [Paramacrobiotus metropolitanus]
MDSENQQPDSFSFVADNLYLGSYRSICALQDAAKESCSAISSSSLEVDSPAATVSTELALTRDTLSKSAILTVDTQRLPPEVANACRSYKYIKVEDSFCCDLLSHFDEAIVFIHDNRTTRTHVLVHCNAGISRSVTVVAAYLMREKCFGVDDALGLIRTHRPGVMPNSNFLEQLRLYELMGNKIDVSSRLYRQWKLKMAAPTGIPEGDIESVLVDSPQTTDSARECFCCRICRCPLFLPDNLLTHRPSDANVADTSAAFPSKVNKPLSESGTCSRGELFIEPVIWMKDEIMETRGKLNCPKCKKKVGTFSWVGERCPCGTFVTPAFHMDKGKVEHRKRFSNPS